MASEDTAMSSNWILPLQSKSDSLSYKQCFLWNSGNVYVMDNHRAALWCWLQHIDLRKTYTIFHIDAHYDTIAPPDDLWISKLPAFEKLTFDQFHQTKDPNCDFPAIRWDNFLTVMLEKYVGVVERTFFATHKIGDPPQNRAHEDVSILRVADFYHDEVVVNSDEARWVIDIDLDYFFYSDEIAVSRKHSPLFSSEFISSVARSTALACKKNNATVVTIALSPECCGGWDNSERVLVEFVRELGLKLELNQGAI